MRSLQLLLLACALLNAPIALAVQPDEVMSDPALEGLSSRQVRPRLRHPDAR